MKRLASISPGLALVALVGMVGMFGMFGTWPVVAYACPMCFDGGNSNQSAFLYGSLFLMIVPVTALGGLGYWAYRRMRAAEARDRALLQEQAAANAEARRSLHLVR